MQENFASEVPIGNFEFIGDIIVAFTKEDRAVIVKNFGKNEKDSGAIEVQVAFLTKRIEMLKGHFAQHKKDHASRRGLLKMVGLRRRQLRYLKRTNLDAYRGLIARLGLRK